VRALVPLLLLLGCPTSPVPEPPPADDDDSAGPDEPPPSPTGSLVELFDPAPEPTPTPPPCPAGPLPTTAFADVTACAGIDAPHSVPDPDWFPFGAAWADFDGDGALDLFVTDSGGPDHWFASDGQGRFVEQPLVPAGEPFSPTSGVAAGDLDGDGDIDLAVEGLGALTVVRNDDGALVPQEPAIWHGARGSSVALADYDGDGALDAYATRYSCPKCEGGGPGADDALYQGGWVDTTAQLPGAIDGFGFVARWLDIDADGDQDLYVVNDRGTYDEEAEYTNRNVLFRNDGPGCGGWCWSEVGRDLGVDLRLNGMGIAVGDVDADGTVDLVVSDSQVPSLLLQSQFGFVESAAARGLTTLREGWGLALFDADNDGDLDLFLPSGSMGEGGGQPDVLWRNDGEVFVDVSEGSGLDHGGNTIGAAVADYDGDGWLDLLVGGADEGHRLLRNLGGQHPATADNHWIAFELEGGEGLPSPPVGAHVVVVDTSGRTQRRDLAAGSGLGVTHSPRLHVGLGSATVVQATITWPDGRQLVLPEPAHDRLHVLTPL